MVVNDDAGGLVKRGALEPIASGLAPTGIALSVFPGIARGSFFMPETLLRRWSKRPQNRANWPISLPWPDP
ncbi:hypothetical protein DBR45_52700 [Pseudomonas sp. HMWF031]|nr:hypothetical protein DBR45_52700 [Pseudomonas sp. HMWF031]